MKIIFSVIVALVVSCSFAKDERSIAGTDALTKLQNSRLYFARNDGQIDTHGKADCRFTTSVDGAKYFFCADGIVADYQKRVVGSQLSVVGADHRASSFEQIDYRQLTTDFQVQGHVLKLNFLARTNFLADIRGEDEQEYKCNYFIGNVPEKWHTNVPNYSRIVYKDVWQGVDVMYYGVCKDVPSRQSGMAHLEYDVIVHPGANPNEIQFAYEGQDALSIDSKGNLVLKTSVGDVIEQTPYVYQIIDGVKKEIPSSFIFHLSSFCVQVGSYDHAKELVIDPAYSTYLGGSKNDAGNAIAVDAAGCAYVAGSAESNNFPTTAGARFTTKQSNYSFAFVTKLNAAGSALVFSTFLGATNNMSMAYGIAVDVGGNAFVTGSTSNYFPTTQGSAYPGHSNEVAGNLTQNDAFVTKLSATGSSLLYSTYLGGVCEDTGYAIAIDSLGSAYVTGRTGGGLGTTNMTNTFPTTKGAYQPAAKGYSSDAFVAKLNAAGSALEYSTFLGGAIACDNTSNSYTECSAIAVDQEGSIYVTGFTSCRDYPTTINAYQTIQDPQKPSVYVVMTKLKPTGQSINDLIYSTYVGSGKGYGIAVDTGGNTFMTGYTEGNYPTTNGAFQTIYGGGTSYGERGDAFVTKLKPSGKGTNDLLYSSYLGGSKSDYGYGVAVDADGNAFITGYTQSSTFPTTTGTLMSTGKNVFMTRLRPAGQGPSDLLYSTYVGAGIGTGIAVDTGRNVFITGSTSSKTFPTTVGAYQTGKGGIDSLDAFVKKFDFNPEIAVTDSLDLGRVMCDTTQKTFLIQSEGDLSLKIDSIKIVDTTNFTIVSPTDFPIVVAPNATLQLTVNFKPGAPGTKKTIVKIYSNDHTPLADNLKQVFLTGVVDSKDRFLAINKTKIDFGSIGCDSIAPDLQIKVYNTSNTLLKVKPIIEGSESSFYTITPSDTTVIDATDSVVFTVHFQPMGGWPYNAILWFSIPQCSQIDTVVLTGIKNSTANFTATPDTIEYFSCSRQSVDSVIIIKNIGANPLHLDSGVISGSGFTLISPTGTMTIAPGDSVKYVIRFTPKQLDKYTGTFRLNGPCKSFSKHDLVGWNSYLLVTPKVIDIGTLNCNDKYSDTIVTVTAKGGKAIVTATISGESFIALTQSDTIKTDSSKYFHIRFKPDSVGVVHAKLVVTSSICPSLHDTVELIGKKVSTACLTAGQSILRFDTISCATNGSQDEYDTVTICNCGSQTITLDSAHVSGDAFMLTDPAGKITLAAGKCQKYEIYFSPTGTGAYNGAFSVHGMPCYVGDSVSLQGVCKSTSGASTEKGLSLEFSLGQNHPNPFSQSSVVGYQLSGERSGMFEVRDMLGRIVYRTSATSVTTQIMIDASAWPKGMYLYSLSDGKNIQSRMMMVAK